MKTRLAALMATLCGLAQAQPARVPNDPLFGLQKSFGNLDIVRAWSITTGSRSVIVAVLDDGFFYRHEDIADNVWRNPGESGTDSRGAAKEINGVDDDANGYVDDVVGYDFAFDDPDPDAYVFDGMNRDRIQPNRHSIPALGVIGARGNNGVGVAGIAWETSLMLLKIGAQGVRRGEVDRRRKELAAKAIRYAVDNGARVINWSGFVDDKDPAALSALKQAFDHAESRGVLIVLAAGNNGTNFDLPRNATYPMAFGNSNILRVAEVDSLGRLEPSSTFGARFVHVGAIGRHFATVVVNGRSAYDVVRGGTSNSAPVATGVAALVLSARPDLSGRQVMRILMDSARPAPALKGKLVTGGIVDAFAAVTAALRYPK